MQASKHASMGLVSRIQRFSTKDGPGIRTTAFFKGCSLNCPWCANPELISPRPQMLTHRSRCIQCGACLECCPEDALSMRDGQVLLDRQYCTACGACMEACTGGVYERVGRNIQAPSFAKELMRDRVFFETSQGGVTLSGGEPALQPDFAADVARRLHAEGIHVAMDTAGHVPWDNLLHILPYLDLILYDIKFADSDLHTCWTGVDNDLILSNLRRISAFSVPLWIRLLILPGINDHQDELQARFSIAANTPGVERIDLLPYHAYGEGKYALLGRTYSLSHVSPPTDAHIQQIRQQALGLGLTVFVGG